MSRITVPRPDVTADQVSDALRAGLGDSYNVLTGTGMNINPVGKPRPDHPDIVAVGTGSNRVFRAEVTITRQGDHSVLHVIPGGISPPLRLTNRYRIVRRVHRVLEAAPSLQ
jgi:hypothetical protein